MDKNFKKPFVSIVVPARDEEDKISGCVDSLLNLTYAGKEIIVIDDGSTDRTGEILKSYGDRIKVLRTKGVGPSKGRNLAVDTAKGEYIAFTDADCIVSRDWIEKLLEGFVNDRVFGVGGAQLAPPDEKPFGRTVTLFFSLFGFVSNYIHGKGRLSAVEHNPTCNVIYKRGIFGLVGKFREDLWPCEDLEFDIRARKMELELMNNPEAKVYHYRPDTYRGFLRMMYRYGLAHSKLNTIHGFTQAIHYIPLVIFMYFLFNVLLYKYMTNRLILVNIIFFFLFLFVLSLAASIRNSIKVLGLLISCIFSWLLGYFVGAGSDLWVKSRV